MFDVLLHDPSRAAPRLEAALARASLRVWALDRTRDGAKVDVALDVACDLASARRGVARLCAEAGGAPVLAITPPHVATAALDAGAVDTLTPELDDVLLVSRVVRAAGEGARPVPGATNAPVTPPESDPCALAAQLLAVAERFAAAEGRALADLDPNGAFGCLDRAAQAIGAGRLAFDVTPRDAGYVEVLTKPNGAARSVPFEQTWIAHLLGALVGRPVVARLRERDDPARIPRRFAVQGRTPAGPCAYRSIGTLAAIVP